MAKLRQRRFTVSVRPRWQSEKVKSEREDSATQKLCYCSFLAEVEGEFNLKEHHMKWKRCGRQSGSFLRDFTLALAGCCSMHGRNYGNCGEFSAQLSNISSSTTFISFFISHSAPAISLAQKLKRFAYIYRRRESFSAFLPFAPSSTFLHIGIFLQLSSTLPSPQRPRCVFVSNKSLSAMQIHMKIAFFPSLRQHVSLSVIADPANFPLLFLLLAPGLHRN